MKEIVICCRESSVKSDLDAKVNVEKKFVCIQKDRIVFHGIPIDFTTKREMTKCTHCNNRGFLCKECLTS